MRMRPGNVDSRQQLNKTRKMKYNRPRFHGLRLVTHVLLDRLRQQFLNVHVDKIPRLTGAPARIFVGYGSNPQLFGR